MAYTHITATVLACRSYEPSLHTVTDTTDGSSRRSEDSHPLLSLLPVPSAHAPLTEKSSQINASSNQTPTARKASAQWSRQPEEINPPQGAVAHPVFATHPTVRAIACSAPVGNPPSPSVF